MSRVRAALPQLHASAPGGPPRHRPRSAGHPAPAPERVFVGLYNVTDSWRSFPVARLAQVGITTPFDALSGHDLAAGFDGLVWLSPYAARWVIDGG